MLFMKVSRTFQGDSGSFRGVPEVFQGFLRGSYEVLLSFLGPFRGLLSSLGGIKNVLWGFMNFLMGFRQLQVVSGAFWYPRGVPVRIRGFKSVPKFSGIFQGISGRFGRIQGVPGLFQGVSWGFSDVLESFRRFCERFKEFQQILGHSTGSRGFQGRSRGIPRI